MLRKEVLKINEAFPYERQTKVAASELLKREIIGVTKTGAWGHHLSSDYVPFGVISIKTLFSYTKMCKFFVGTVGIASSEMDSENAHTTFWKRVGIAELEQGSLNYIKKSRNIQEKGVDVELEQTFYSLANKWRHDVRAVSAVEKMAMHTCYQKIISMGWDAVPLILRELQREPDHWFWALHVITGENPVKSEDAGDIDKMAKAWIEWGRKKGY